MKEILMLKPIKQKVLMQLVSAKDQEKVLDSGFILMGPERGEAQRANVLEVGPDCEYVKKGDVIIPNWNAAQQVKYEREDYYFIEEAEVVLIVDEPKPTTKKSKKVK
jgi:co-chaperonin GroES (HSP10)